VRTKETRVNSRARIGVIGAGWWVTENHIPLLEGRSDIELAAVCRRSPEELRRVKDRFGFTFATTDYREMLETPLDGVIVGSPHDRHHEHARTALGKGLHVLVEKPLALKSAEARELVQLAGRRGRQILIPYGWNFRPYTREARRLMRAGAVGEVEHVICQMASPRREQYSDRSALSTYADPERGGGYGWGQLVHALSLLFRITEQRVQRVFSVMGRSPTGVDLYDALALSFEGGATGVFSGAATVPGHLGYQLDLRIFGSEGMMLFDVERERLEVRRHDREDVAFPMEPGSGGYECVEPVERFADICLGKEVENDGPGEVGARAVEVLEAAYRSARSGRMEET
jgi:predicted dehydrogenase